MRKERQDGARKRPGRPGNEGGRQNNTRLLVMLGIGAVLVAGLLVALSALGEGQQEDLGAIPQNGTTLGNADAPVTIRLYEDFQCPACGQFARETLPGVVDRYVRPGDAKLVSETLAFLGPDSVPAARAALAAGSRTSTGSTPACSSRTRAPRTAATSPTSSSSAWRRRRRGSTSRGGGRRGTTRPSKKSSGPSGRGQTRPA
ncbi:thioredoxin domain-containing protein [Rubrobacter tropicus]|nr:thioredoxin domain-containing protein [Rubrobacter tropicus]